MAADRRGGAPDLIDLEVLSVWRRQCRLGELGERHAVAARADLVALPLRRVAHRALLARCWEHRDNLTADDAAYVALAELLAVPLVTADARLGRAPVSRAASTSCTVRRGRRDRPNGCHPARAGAQ